AWRSGMGGLAVYQRPYVQLLRLGRWFGTLRATPANTPFEVAEHFSRQVPRAGSAVREVTAAYVEGTYANRTPSDNPWPTWLLARRDVIRALFRRRRRRWFGDESVQQAPRSRPELLRRWGASHSTPPRSGKPRQDR